MRHEKPNTVLIFIKSDNTVILLKLVVVTHILLERPRVTIKPSQTITASEGEEVRLVCISSGDPLPSAVWVKLTELCKCCLDRY